MAEKIKVLSLFSSGGVAEAYLKDLNILDYVDQSMYLVV